MAKTQNGFYCKTGDMHLSEYLSTTFVRQFIEKTEPFPDIAPEVNWGGGWFCPACGKEMKEEDGAVRCPICNINMTKYLHQLIELHPHKQADGTWR
jgi:rubrerythrin